jgi:hypothetical protein
LIGYRPDDRFVIREVELRRQRGRKRVAKKYKVVHPFNQGFDTMKEKDLDHCICNIAENTGRASQAEVENIIKMNERRDVHCQEGAILWCNRNIAESGVYVKDCHFCAHRSISYQKVTVREGAPGTLEFLRIYK